LRVDDRGQVAPLDVLHHQEVDPLGLPGIVSRDHVRVVELGGGLDLALEALDGLRRLDGHRRQDLQGDQAFHLAVTGLEDLAHPPLADLVQDHVLAQHEALHAALANLAGLVLGEPAGLDQQVGQGGGVVGAFFGRKVLAEGDDLVGGQQAAVDKIPDQSLPSQHGWLPPKIQSSF
jgi:hypothetical protein